MINNRQAGRRRGRGGGGGNGQRQGGNPGRPDSGNRIDSRARGNANQLYEKYKNLASDSQRQGDRVTTEYYLQFADHYFRVLSEQRGRFEEQQPRRQRDDFDFDGDEDFGDEGDPIRAGEQAGDERPRGDRDDRGRDERGRDDRPRDGNRREGREGEGRPAEMRNGEGRGEGRGEARGEGRNEGRGAEGRNDGRNGRRREWEPRERRPQLDADVAGQDVVEDSAPAASVAVQQVEAAGDAPRRRGRPRRTPEAQEETASFEADRLPPALTVAANDSGEPAEPKPRRRRVRAAEVPTAAE